MSIETKHSYLWQDEKGRIVERFLTLVEVTVDPCFLIEDERGNILYSWDDDRETQALCVANIIRGEIKKKVESKP